MFNVAVECSNIEISCQQLVAVEKYLMRKIIPVIFVFLLFIDSNLTSSVVFVKTPFLNDIM